MPRSNITVSLFLPTNSTARIGDFLTDFNALCVKHKAQEPFTTMTGPHPDINSEAKSNERVGRDRTEHGRRAAEDFAEGTDAEGQPEPGSADEPDAPAEPKRRGRPPGTGKRGAEAGSGSAEGGRKRAEGTAGGSEGTARTEPVGTRQVAGEGAGEGKGGRGGAGRGRDDQRGDREASGVKPGADFAEWDDAEPAKSDEDDRSGLNDEEGPDWWCKTPDTKKNSDGRVIADWPDHLTPDDIDEGTIAELLASHYQATGGKDRNLTFSIMEAATGERSVKNVHPDDYDNLARHLLKDAARYTHGVKKPK